MALVDLPTAVTQLRADAGDAKIAPLLAAAERFVLERLARGVYVDANVLAAARAAAPAALAAAKSAYTAATDAAALLEDEDLREAAERYALNAYAEAAAESDRAQAGMVINDDIVAAILLKLEELYDGTDTERAVKSLLDPHRAGMGV